MNVLSLFDGISCGRVALERAGLPVTKYYASEIDVHAKKISAKNWPDIIQVGDVASFKVPKNGKIDLLIGGSPCQGFSFAGKQLNFDDPRSKLFFEYVRILNEARRYNPEVKFLLENVKMKKEYQAVISNLLGVQPIEINSALVSAQQRRRLYWTNISNVLPPADKNIKLIDILEFKDFVKPASIIGRRLTKAGQRDDYNKKIPIIQYIEVRANCPDKSKCLTTVEKDNILTNLPIGRHPRAFENKHLFRYYTLSELCKLQNLPTNYFDSTSLNSAKKMIGNCWTVDVIVHILSYLNK